MSKDVLSLVFAPYADPADGPDWDEQTPLIIEEMTAELSECPVAPLRFELRESDHGIGADWPTLSVEYEGATVERMDILVR